MKKILYLLIAVVFFASACEQEDNILRYELGTEFLVSGSYTSLDNQVTISIANDQKNLSEITVTHLGGLTTDVDADGELVPFDPPNANLGTITVSDGSGSKVITDTELGMTEIGWSADFQFDAAFDGKPIVRYFTLAVDNPISITAPEIVHKDTTYHFVYEIAPESATVTSVVVETKVFSTGTYVPVTPIEGSMEEDSIAFSALNYNVADTIYVKITAGTGTKTAISVTKIVVEPYSYKGKGTFALDTKVNLAHDLILDRKVEPTIEYGDSVDIEFVPATLVIGGYEIGFESNQNAEFVLATADDYENGDIVDSENATFTGLQTINNVTKGDVYFYRTQRGTGDYAYGVLKIINVDKPQDAPDDASIEIEYKYTEAE